ncbi:site-specific integrase [Lysinibacillus sphaericus]|uniref:tyrosine-type recombinase/integrase n=1 Tax=Lysinibacillus sphaericus TaxID=1421 RepID=UPI001E542F83|nr:site-specific integrase [Lysinibacillus sphaericus]UDK98251.1 site-specific integrase [Lysinibacillus sphaericus]
MGELVQVHSIIESKKVNEAIQQEIDKKSKMYEGDFKRFEQYAKQQSLELSFATLERYLLHTIETGLKLSTFNKRSAGVKHYLVNHYKLIETEDQSKRITLLRQKYNHTDYAKQKLMKGQSAQSKNEVMALIEKLDTRAKAIALFNLITACRPSEMINIKIEDIDLDTCSVNVYMQKQSEWKSKRLTLECVNAVRAYIKEYGLTKGSYLVGKVDKHNKYHNTKISDTAYRKSIHKWLGFAPYTLRKTQISAMHEAGADLATIAKQSGHKNLETINKHYLSVNDRTIDKYL